MPEITKNKIIQKSLVSKHTFQMVKLLLITKNYIILEMKFCKSYQKKKEYYNHLSKELSDPLTSPRA